MYQQLCLSVSRYKEGRVINQRPEFKIKRMRVHLNHALEIKEVYQEDAGLYTVALRNTAAALERRLNITLVVNGEYCFSLNQIKSGGVKKTNRLVDHISSPPVPPQIHEKEVAEPSSPYPSGSSQTLTCTAYGLPAPNISWQWRPWGPCVLSRQ